MTYADTISEWTRAGWKISDNHCSPTRSVLLSLMQPEPFLEPADCGLITHRQLIVRARRLRAPLGLRHAVDCIGNPEAIPRAWQDFYLLFPGTMLWREDPRHDTGHSWPCLMFFHHQWSLAPIHLLRGYGGYIRLMRAS